MEPVVLTETPEKDPERHVNWDPLSCGERRRRASGSRFALRPECGWNPFSDWNYSRSDAIISGSHDVGIRQTSDSEGHSESIDGPGHREGHTLQWLAAVSHSVPDTGDPEFRN